MMRKITSFLVIAVAALTLASCGVKSPPKYSPNAPTSEQKKS
jgi:predicted small lipoprotein YifL|tara:strand:+ start:218 stop:343 length:126 start_codon:yes stop_codon:yes gene_type:complete